MRRMPMTRQKLIDLLRRKQTKKKLTRKLLMLRLHVKLKKRQTKRRKRNLCLSLPSL